MIANELSKLLATRAEELAAELLPHGTRAGAYWQAGDIYGGKGQSLYLRLTGARAGQWADAATGEYGDLLDLIARQSAVPLAQACKIAADRLKSASHNVPQQPVTAQSPTISPDFISALWGRAKPLAGPAAAYLTGRGISDTALAGITDLRFMPDCQLGRGAEKRTLPALMAAVRDEHGQLTGLHRTYLSAEGHKADIPVPKRALGRLASSGCWLAPQGRCLVIAEGIETALSLRTVWPKVALVAALSAQHMARLAVPSCFPRIVIAADADEAGLRASRQLADRMSDREVRIVRPQQGDFNDLLQTGGAEALRDCIRPQLK